MNAKTHSIHCSPQVFLENHVDFDHFEVVHGNYSDPKLIHCSYQNNQYTAVYSLCYGRLLKRTIVYHYTVTRISETRWQATIDTKDLGINYRVSYEAEAIADKETTIRIDVRASAPLLPNIACHGFSMMAKRLTTREFYRDKSVIEGPTNRFPKPHLEPSDTAIKIFRTFAK